MDRGEGGREGRRGENIFAGIIRGAKSHDLRSTATDLRIRKHERPFSGFQKGSREDPLKLNENLFFLSVPNTKGEF